MEFPSFCLTVFNLTFNLYSIMKEYFTILRN